MFKYTNDQTFDGIQAEMGMPVIVGDEFSSVPGKIRGFDEKGQIVIDTVERRFLRAVFVVCQTSEEIDNLPYSSWTWPLWFKKQMTAPYLHSQFE